MPEQLLIPQKEAAAMLGVSIRTIAYLTQRRELRATRIGRKVLFHRDEIARFAERNHPGPVARERK